MPTDACCFLAKVSGIGQLGVENEVAKALLVTNLSRWLVQPCASKRFDKVKLVETSDGRSI